MSLTAHPVRLSVAILLAVVTLVGLGSFRSDLLAWWHGVESITDAVRANPIGGGAVIVGLVLLVAVNWTAIAPAAWRMPEKTAGAANGSTPSEQELYVALKRLKRGTLERRSYGGVLWPVLVINGEIHVGKPLCPGDNERLEYRPSTHSNLGLVISEIFKNGDAAVHSSTGHWPFGVSGKPCVIYAPCVI